MDRNISLVVLAAALVFAAFAWSPWSQKGRWHLEGSILLDTNTGDVWVMSSIDGGFKKVHRPSN